MKLIILISLLFLFISTAHAAQGDWTLQWNPNKDTVTGYIIFESSALGEPLSEFKRILHSDENKNTEGAIFVTFPQSELTTKGPQVCFRLKAYNVVDESGFSEAVCGKKLLVPSAPTGFKLLVL